MKSDKRRFHFYPPLLTFGNIAKHCLMIAVAAIGLCLAGCDEYDDTELWNAVKDHEQRLAALEQWQAEVNNNIAALQTLLNTNDMITDVTPVTMGDEVTGYTISFLHSAPITIYNGTQGEKGETGDTPQIGLTQQEDGNWYWTLNGELMRDAEGNPIRANGEDGKDGQDGADGEDGEDGQDGSTGATGRPGQDGKDAPIPEIKLGSSLKDNANVTILPEGSQIEDDAWYLNVDDTNNWYRVSGADGSNGDSFFESIEPSEDGKYYIFTLSGSDTPIKVPAYQGITLTFTDIDDLSQVIQIGKGSSREIPFEVKGAADAIVTALVTAEGWKATVSDGSITVTAGTDATSSDLVVIASDNAGNSVSYTLRLEAVSHTIEDDGTYTVYTAAGLQAWGAAARSATTGINCTLAADIDMTGESWTAVFPSNAQYYIGTFDGNGHTIRNLSNALISDLGDKSTVKNLVLDNPTVTTINWSGAITRSNYGTIENCHVVGGSIKATTDYGNAGGIAGTNTGTIRACSSSATVSSSWNSNSGGIVGSNDGQLITCYAIGTASVSSGQAGAIAGLAYSDAIFTACYWSGTAECAYWIQYGYPITYEKVTGNKVEDETTWATAAEEMNKQLTNGYQWVENNNTETKESRPLILQEITL